MKCEYCSGDHDGSYGSGRFCGVKCARGFSTKADREAINRKVKEKLRGRRPKYFHHFTSEEIQRGVETRIKRARERLLKMSFDNLSIYQKRKRLLLEQKGKCSICGIGSWNGKPLSLRLDHINGKRENETRENLRMICPNCDSQTSTYGSKNASKEGRKKMAENGKNRKRNRNGRFTA